MDLAAYSARITTGSMAFSRATLETADGVIALRGKIVRDEAITDRFSGRVRMEAAVPYALIRAAAAPAVRRGDHITVGAERFEIQSAVRREDGTIRLEITDAEG